MTPSRLLPALLPALLLTSTACTVQVADVSGKRCDTAHPCPSGFQCLAEACVPQALVIHIPDGGEPTPVDPTASLPCLADARMGTTCSAGNGACRQEGRWLCEKDGSLVCSARALPSSGEVCDGKDNDCDGVVDELSQCVSTAAGQGLPGFKDGPLMEARFMNPTHILALSEDELLVSDTGNAVIRRVNLSTQQVTTEAGSPGFCASTNGGPGQGLLCEPRGMSKGPDGEVYIADRGTDRIRRLKDGYLTTVAGSRWIYPDSDPTNAPVPANQAHFASPTGVAYLNGSLYVADSWYCVVRKIDLATHMVSYFAGQVDLCGWLDGDRRTAARFMEMSSIVATNEGGGRLYVGDTEIDYKDDYGIIRTIDVASGKVGSLTGPTPDGRTDVIVSPAYAIFPHADGLFTADAYNNRIRLHPPMQAPVNLVGSATNPPGWKDHPSDGTLALTTSPNGVAVVGNYVYFTGKDDHRLRRYDRTTKAVETIAGGEAVMMRDGPRESSVLANPRGLTYDPATETAYFVDQYNHAVRALSRDGVVTTIAGTGSPGPADDSREVPAREATFNYPVGLAWLGNGRIAVADSRNRRLRLVDVVKGTVSTLAGTGPIETDTCTSKDGSAKETAVLCSPYGVTGGPNGEVYFVERFSGKLRTVFEGEVTTLPLPVASLVGPVALVYGSDDKLYVVDHDDHTLKQVNPVTAEVKTVLGTGECGDEGGPDPLQSQLCDPTALVEAAPKVFYIVSSGEHEVRRWDALGVVSVAGISQIPGSADGHTRNALLSTPWGISPAPGNGFYITDSGNNRIRRVVP